MDITLGISDDSGFIGLVNVDRYASFVKEDWMFNDLQERFIQEMNKGSLLFWSTGLEGRWNVRITTAQENTDPFRTFSGKMTVTNGKLFLVNYEDLSVAAQFQDEKLPLKHNADLEVKIENGHYNLQINQLFDPRTLIDDDEDKVHFEVIIEKAHDGQAKDNMFNKIPWLH